MDAGRKIAKALYFPISTLLNPLGKNGKDPELEAKKSKTRVQRHNNIKWIDIENPDAREINKLEGKYGFHYLYLQASLLKAQPQQIEKEESYIFLILHIPSYEGTENKVITSQLSVFLGKDYLITIHDDTFPLITDIFEKCISEKEYKEKYFRKTSGYILYNLLDTLARDTNSLAQMISQELDEIEDIVFDVKSSAYRISQLRQKIVRLRRILNSWKNILEEFAPIMSEITGDSHSRYYGSLTSVIDRLRDTIEEARETVEIYQDADYIVSSEKTNETLGILTIIFTLTIPATVIGTFYGMNILLPGGLEAGSWNFFGPYTAFILIIIFSSSIFLIMLWFFKIKKWF